jgi:ATP-dependent DNA ligase
MDMNIFINAEVGKYWSLPLNASATQKQKLNKAVYSNDYIGSIKKDGAHYWLIKTNDDDIRLLSRTFSKKDGCRVDKIDNVPHLKEWAIKNLPNETVLVGEIHLGIDYTSADVVSIMGCLAPKAIARQKDIGEVDFYVFDVLAYAGISLLDTDNEERILKIFQNLSKKLENTADFIQFAEYFTDNLADKIATALANGEEGLVLLRKKAKYKFGSAKAWDTIKYKQELAETVDAIIIGYSDPEPQAYTKDLMNWKYWENLKTGELEIGSFALDGGYRAVNKNYFMSWVSGFRLGLINENGETIEIGTVSNLTDKIRIEISKGFSYIGRIAEIQAMSIDQERLSLRHAKLINFRDDKDIAECRWEKYFVG